MMDQGRRARGAGAWRSLLVGALLGVMSSALAAQGVPLSVSGAVAVDAASGEPGATLVQLVDARGTVVAVSRPGRGGQFTLRAPAAGRYRLRLLRLGFTPLERDVQVGPGALALGSLAGPRDRAQRLDVLEVRSSSACGDVRGTGAAADRWRQVEVGLAAHLTDDGRSTSQGRWQHYVQRTHPRTGAVEALEVRDDPPGSGGGFLPIPAERLAQTGFVDAATDSVTYYVPVPRTLLAPEFLALYCFRVGSARADTLSIAFEPRVRSQERVDLTGTLVFSRDGAHLEEIRFAYRFPLTVGEGARAQGLLRFSTDSTPDVAAWWVDTPLVAPAVPGLVVGRRRVGARRLDLAGCVGCGPPAGPTRGPIGPSVAPTQLALRVVDAQGRPVRGAESRVESAAGAWTLLSDDAGRGWFTLPDTGNVRLTVRRVGYGETSHALRVGPGTTDVELELLPARADALAAAQQLAAVRVEARPAISSRLSGFEQRVSERRPNAVLRGEALERSGRFATAMSQVMGVFVHDSAGVRGVRAYRTANLATSPSPVPGCPLRLFVDGTPHPRNVSIDDLPPVATLYGVEVYLSMARVPAEYAGTLGPGECGVLLVWTRDALARPAPRR